MVAQPRQLTLLGGQALGVSLHLLLLAAHPLGLVVGDIQRELGIPNSTLSHHLEKLRHKGLVRVRREGTFLWYTADTEALGEILAFLQVGGLQVAGGAQ